MEIKTPRLCLRPADMSYLATTHAYASDLENTKFMMFLPYASLEETAQALRGAEEEWRKSEPARCEFVILKDGAQIGDIALYFTADRSRAELSWIIDKAFWRQGYASEAAGALIDYARKQWGVRSVFACCDAENIGSRRVMEKLGMHCVDCGGRRKNRSSDEERTELIYEMTL